MRQSALWMLLALTAALLLAASVARADTPTEPEGPATKSAFAEGVREELRSWFGPAALPERLTLQTPIGGAFCEETGLTEIWLLVSGGVPPYTITVDGQQVDGSIGYVLVNCRPLETSLPPCDPLRSSHRTVRTTATDSRGVSAKTEVRIELGDPPSPVEPGAVRQDASAGAGLRLSWTPPADTPPVCAYELQYQATAWDATSWPDSWTTINDTIAAGATEYLHSGLDPNRRYRYELRAKNNIGASYWSPAFPEAGVRPGAPALAAQTAASGSVALSWSAAPADATHWEYRRRQEGGSWSVWTAIVGASTAEHTVSGLTEDVRYQFQLRAHTAGGAGPASATAIAVAGLTPTVPSERQSLRYDDLDSTGGATRPSSYAFLKDADDLTSGAATFAEVSPAEALLLNVSGYARRYYGAVLTSVRVGDRFTWHPYSGCWYHYRVTEVLPVPTTTAPGRRLFRIALEAEDPCGVAAARAGNAKSYFDESRDTLAAFRWGDPPNASRVGADGIRIMSGRYAAEGGHTYRLIEQGPIVIDVPAGMRLRFGSGALTSRGTASVWYFDEVSGGEFGLDPYTGEDPWYYVETPEGETEPPADVVAQLEALVDSIRELPLPATTSDE